MSSITKQNQKSIIKFIHSTSQLYQKIQGDQDNYELLQVVVVPGHPKYDLLVEYLDLAALRLKRTVND